MNQSEYDGVIDIRAYFARVWRARLFIGVAGLLAALIGVAIALALPNIYRSQALLMVSKQDGGGALSGLASQYGGLASLAGINLGGGGGDNTQLGIETLKSRKFLGGFIERHDLALPLVAAEGFDPATRELLIDDDIYDQGSGEWVRRVSFPKQLVPTTQELYEEFREILTVQEDRQTGFITVAVEHESPVLAQQWTMRLINELNTTVMQEDVARAEQAIAYLNEQVGTTNLSGLQSVFFGLIEEQTKTVMLAKASPEYLFRIIDPPVVAEEKVRPARALLVILAGLIGALIAGLLAMLLPRYRSPAGPRE